MSKNQVLNCKSHKQERDTINQPKEKLFCPPTMKRFDNLTSNEYKVVWACKICFTCILSEAAVVNHMTNTCSGLVAQNPPSPPQK